RALRRETPRGDHARGRHREGAEGGHRNVRRHSGAAHVPLVRPCPAEASPGRRHAMKSVEIDRNKALRAQPSKGHNRLHPDLAPIIEVNEREEVILETLDATDGQLGPSTTAAAISSLD